MAETFHSFETNTPFQHCCDCGCNLVNAEMFIVNQSFVGGECVFEFAICHQCRQKMHDQLSEESRVAMFDFMHDHVDMKSREKELGYDSETDDYLAACISCHQPRALTKSYTLGGMFSGTELLKGPFPMLMCSTCEEALAETLSDVTLHSSLFTLHSSLFTLHSSLFTLHSSLFTLHSSLFTLPHVTHYRSRHYRKRHRLS